MEKKRRSLILILRVGFFLLVLTIGTTAALVVDETPGLALAELPDAPVRTMTGTAQGEVAYVVMGDEIQPKRIYRSDDHGQTWRSVRAESEAGLSTLTVHPTDETILYAGSLSGSMDTTTSLRRSVDGGQTWQPFNLNLPAGPDHVVPTVTALAIDPNRPDVLYVGTDGQSVYRFETGRIGYELLGGTSLPATRVNNLVIDTVSRLYALTDDGLFVMNGNTWQPISSLPEVPISLAVAPTDPQVLYAGAPSSGLYRSTDGGQSWASANDGLGLVPGAALRITALVVDDQDPEHVAAATAYGLGSHLAAGSVYESGNGGDSWARLSQLDEIVTQLSFNNGRIYAATADGLEQYGQPDDATPLGPLSHLRALGRPSGTQLLIMISTTAIGALVLLGRVEWLLK